jgi:transposase
MSTMTTRRFEDTTDIRPTLYLAFELGDTWKIAFTTGLGQRPRVRGMPVRDLKKLKVEIAAAKKRFGLPADALVVSCYEAGRDGFWLHRALVAEGIGNQVVDSSSIEVNRRARRAKADRLDAEKLVLMLVRFAAGDRRVWHVVRVPSDAEEHRRELNREIDAVTRDRTRILNRLHGLLAKEGVPMSLRGDVPAALTALRRWDGSPLPAPLLARLQRDVELVQHLHARIRTLKQLRRHELRATPTGEDAEATRQMQALYGLRGIGEVGAHTYVREFFGWRRFTNRRQVGGLAGLAPTPYASGASMRELGMSKAGNRRVRYIAIELAWIWLRQQPRSALSQWYERRFGTGSSRLRRIGIVALARKVLIALWRYLETGVIPEGAQLKA